MVISDLQHQRFSGHVLHSRERALSIFYENIKGDLQVDHFKLHSKYKPTGDQPQAIEELVRGFREGNQFETLLGVTGSGKTFTMANVIEQRTGRH